MSRHPGTPRGTLVSLLGALLVGVIGAATAQTSGPAPVTGTILSVTGSTIRLALADASTKDVALQPTTLILERDAAAVSDIKTGDALGVAARRDGTDLIATSINIFAKEMWANPKMGKGQWPMSTGETMTNAVVTDYVQAMNGHTLTMKYNSVNATITVPDGIPIHRLMAVKPATLAAGMTISVRGTAGSNGTLKAASISFEGPART
jgi:hypothetical protein